MQETRVWSLVWEDPLCGGATKSIRHNYLALALEAMLCTQQEKPPPGEAHTLQLESSLHSLQEKSLHSNKDPSEPKRNK